MSHVKLPNLQNKKFGSLKLHLNCFTTSKLQQFYIEL